MTGEYSKKFSRAALSHALKAMIASNTWLTYNFFPTSETPTNYHEDYELRCVSQIRFENVLEFRQIGKFDELTLETINTFKNEIGRDDAPLWQLCIFETDTSQYVCGYFCHTLADGGTALQFQRDLLKQLAKYEKETELVDILFDYETAKNSIPEILTAKELLTDLYIPGVFARVKMWMDTKLPYITLWMGPVLNFFKKTFRFGRTETQFFSLEPVTKNLASKFKIINIAPSELAPISQYCRTNSITVTPFLSIVALDCLEKIIFPHFSNGTDFHSSHYMAISGRRYFPEFQNPFMYGVFVCGAPINVPPLMAKSKQDLLAGMKRFHQSIQNEVKTRQSFKLLYMWKYADIAKVLHGKLGKHERYTTTISNLGQVKDEPGEWKLVNAWFSLNTSIGYHFLLDMVSTETGGLNLVVPYLPIYDELTTEFDGKEVLAMEDFVRLFTETYKQLVAV